MANTIQGLDKLLSKYKELANVNPLIVEKFTYVGKTIADKKYSIRNDETDIPLVEQIKKGKKSGKIVASGERLTFEEYGTGTVGKNSGYPQDKLPKSGVPKTKAWVYNYPSKFKRTSKRTGEIFWFYKKPSNEVVISKGQRAGMQMYNTSRELQKQKSNIVNSVVKKITRGQ